MQKYCERNSNILLQANSENMNHISAKMEKSKNHEVSSTENIGFTGSSPTNCGFSTEEELIKCIMKVNNHISKEDNSDSEKERMLFDKFLKEVRSFKPEPIKYWSGLQHYIYFVYRHFLSTKPFNSSEIYPTTFLMKIRELMNFLLKEDRTQLFLRMLALLREFAYIGKECFKNNNVTKVSTNLASLMAYYSAFCSAATKLSPVVSELDVLLMDRFQVNWLCLNKSIFYHYIYLDPCVQSKLPAFVKLQAENKSYYKNLIDSYECFKEDMTLLATRWNNIKMCISILSKKNALQNPEVKLTSDYLTYQEQSKILKTNYWFIRSEKQKKIQDPSEFDAHFLSLVGNLGEMSDALIDKLGHCVCDDCLSDEFTKVIYNLEPDTDINARRISCYMCRDIIPLETFVTHVVTKHEKSSPMIPEKDNKVKTAKKLTNSKLKTREDCEGAEDLSPKSGINGWDESGAMQMMQFTLSQQFTNVESCSGPVEEVSNAPQITAEEFDKQAERLFSEYLRKRAGLTQNQVLEVCKKEAEKVVKRKEKEDKPVLLDNTEKDKKSVKIEGIEKKFAAIAAHRKATILAAYAAGKKDVKKEEERKPGEGKEEVTKYNREKIDMQCPFTKNDEGQSVLVKNRQSSNKENKDCLDYSKGIAKKQHSLRKTTSVQCTGTSHKMNCHENSCSHTCTKEEETSSCCSHHKEVSKKCDCPYCEILGSTIPSVPWQKSSETRDRLRSRLHQRKEKDSKSTVFVSKPEVNPCQTLVDATNFSNSESTSANDFKLGNSRVPIIPDHQNPNNSVTNISTNPSNICIRHKPSRHQKQSFINTVTKSLNNVDPIVSVPETVKATIEQQSVLTGSISSLSSSLNSLRDNGDSRDINELLNFIEGNKKKDKIALAEKKAAKKARQKKRREDEKLRIEMEAKKKEEERLREIQRKEEMLREEKRRKERQAAEAAKLKAKSVKKDIKLVLQPAEKPKNKKQDEKKTKTKVKKSEKHIEETIPAMVTIKRVPENGNATPTVTITLKGSTPDQDRLLYTLVNGQTKDNTTASVKTENNVKKTKNETKSKQENSKESKKTKKQNQNKQQQITETKKNVGNEVKLTLSIEEETVVVPESPKSKKKLKKLQKKSNQKNAKEQENVDLPILRLPPGITITKIDGPSVNRNIKNCKENGSKSSNVTENNSGVIVVDTEKLIQQSLITSDQKKMKKKNKKGNKNPSAFVSSTSSTPASCSHAKDEKSSMVTLKNPIFHSIQSTFTNKNDKLDLHNYACNQQASIIKNENGMVTIRRPRLQQMEDGGNLSSILSDLKPVMEPEVSAVSTSTCFKNVSINENEKKSPFNAQAILSGLPGIEITKIDKNSIKSEFEVRKSNNDQHADVSIIPTCNKAPMSSDKVNDRADWYDNVFTPREDLEEDMDAAERDIEAFKRFCHQTVVPEHKEKVAHLNVQDIVFKKKSDLSFFS